MAGKDNSLFLCGHSSSDPSGLKTSLHYGGGDYWLAKLDARGNVLWDRSFGGSEGEILTSPGVATSDGGFLMGGSSSSGVSGNKTSPSYGMHDVWLVNVNATGNKVWEQSYGGSNWEGFNDAIEVEGGFLVAAYSMSGISGNKTTASYGQNDFWVIRLDSTGNKLWERSFGGNGNDVIYNLIPTPDGNFLLCGESSSPPSGNKTSPRHGQADFWLVKIDPNGNKLWDKSYGGNSFDIAARIVPAGDGGFILGGASSSPISGNKSTAGFGQHDFWLIKVDADGSIMWEHVYGSPARESMTSLAPAGDGGFLLIGQLSGTDSATAGNRTAPIYGSFDFWVIKVDANGTMLWDQSFGGTEFEGPYNLTSAPDGGVLIAGQSSSDISGNKSTAGYGESDAWVIKLTGLPQLTIEPSAGNLRVSWPLSSSGFLLEKTSTLPHVPQATIWSVVPQQFQTNEEQHFIILPVVIQNTFYRLRRP